MDYVSVAIKLATDQDYRHTISHRISEIQDNLFGDNEVIEALQDFFEQALLREA